MAEVHLRPVTAENIAECLALRVDDTQTALVAANATSLAEARVNPNLFPLAIYDAAARGWDLHPPVPMVGFTMYELAAGVGFIMRLMIDKQHQRQGYGRAALREVIRRLKLHPEVELIATSHQVGNNGAAKLYQSLGFTPWSIAWAKDNANETYLMLPD